MGPVCVADRLNVEEINDKIVSHGIISNKCQLEFMRSKIDPNECE